MNLKLTHRNKFRNVRIVVLSLQKNRNPLIIVICLQESLQELKNCNNGTLQSMWHLCMYDYE